MNVEEEKQEITADDVRNSKEDEVHPVNVSFNNVGFGIADPHLTSGSADRVAVAESGGSGTLLHEKLSIAERGSSKWKAFLLRGGPKRGVRRDSILEEKRAIASRSDQMRDSAKQRRLADLVAQSDDGSSSFLEEKQAIARRSYSVRGVASRQRENPNQVAGAASVSISVLDEKRAIATRSDGIRVSLKRRENQSRADCATDGLGNVLDDKLAPLQRKAYASEREVQGELGVAFLKRYSLYCRKRWTVKRWHRAVGLIISTTKKAQILPQTQTMKPEQTHNVEEFPP